MMNSRSFVRFKSVALYAVAGAMLLAAFPVLAADTSVTSVSGLSAQDMLVNISKQVPSLMRLVTAIAYVLGMFFIISGVIKMKHFGESRTMMSQEHSISGPIIMLVVGSMLLYLPSAVQIGLSTFWTDPNPYAYVKESDQWADFLAVCFSIVQLVGTIAFIRGLVILSHMSKGGQQGTVSRGITHIIGGILCINIYQFVQVIAATLGLQFT